MCGTPATGFLQGYEKRSSVRISDARPRYASHTSCEPRSMTGGSRPKSASLKPRATTHPRTRFTQRRQDQYGIRTCPRVASAFRKCGLHVYQTSRRLGLRRGTLKSNSASDALSVTSARRGNWLAGIRARSRRPQAVAACLNRPRGQRAKSKIERVGWVFGTEFATGC
jgi:hypothetical protein